MDDENGQGPLAGWVVAQVQGMTLIGKASRGLSECGRGSLAALGHETIVIPVPIPDEWYGMHVSALSPVFELKPQMAMAREGMQIAHPCLPLWLLGVKSLDLPEGCVVVPCESFTRSQRVNLLRGVRAAEGLEAQFRAEEAGGVLATGRLP